MSKFFKFLGTALIFLAVTLFLQWQVGSTFGVTAPGVGGLVAITIVALLGAWEYAKSDRKQWHHYALALGCLGYLAYGWWTTWGLNPSQREGHNIESEGKRQAHENHASSLRHTDIIATDRKAELQRRRANKPEVVCLVRDAQRDDFRNEAGVMFEFPYKIDTTEVPFPLVAGTKVLYWPATFKEFEGEEYVYIKVYDKPMIKGYFRFFELDESIPYAENHGAAVPLVVAPKRATPALAVAMPATVSEEPVLALKDHWTITKVPVAFEENVWIGPFLSEGDGKRLVVCIDGGQPVAIQPYLWPNGKFGARIHRMSGDHATQYLWLRVSDGAPFTIKLNKNRPY